MENALIKTQDISPIVQMAMKGKFDIAQLDKLIDVQEKFEKIRAEKEFNIAFAKFKKTAPIISKDSRVNFTSSKGVTDYKHASLAGLMKVVTPLLADQGLAIYWIPGNEKGNVTITAVLVHELGHSVNATLSAPPDTTGNKNSLQAVNSTVTYLERYVTFALLGMASAEDNDGQGDTTQTLDYITPDQVENLNFEIDNTQRQNDELTKVICDAYKVPSLQHILSKDFVEILKRITKS